MFKLDRSLASVWKLFAQRAIVLGFVVVRAYDVFSKHRKVVGHN